MLGIRSIYIKLTYQDVSGVWQLLPNVIEASECHDEHLKKINTE